MHWIDTWLVLLAPALAAGVWFIVRWKWYGLIPAVVLGLLAYTVEPYCHPHLQKFFELIAFSQPSERALVWLLASAATLISFTSICAGYSRGYWFWRLSALAGIPALLATVDAKEPILFCLVTMPPIAGGAWLIRRFQNLSLGMEEVRVDQPQNSRARWRWSLRDALLGFVVVGLLAVMLRPLMAGELYFVGRDFLVSSVTFVVISLAAIGAGVARQAGWRWIFSLLTLALMIGGLVVHRFLACDTLGLWYYLEMNSQIPAPHYALVALAVMAITTALVLFSRLYAVVMCSKSPVWKRLAGGLLAVAVLALITPLALVYPRMLPPATKVTPLPPSVTYDRIQYAVGRFSPAPIVKQAKAVLDEPGNVWFSTREVRENDLSLRYHRSFETESQFSFLLEEETAKAELAGRPSECLQLAILQWRLGRVLRRGGLVMDWSVGYRAEVFGCGAITQAADKLSDDECRLALAEVRQSLENRPAVETVLAYNTYWFRAFYGWRDDLNRSARWLAGENPDGVFWGDKQQLQNRDKRGLLRFQLMETRLALELYRREHGQWPLGLQDLVPKYLAVIPADPYSSASLIYRRQDESFLLYSVGPDGRDDGCRQSNNADPHILENFDISKLEGFDIDWDFDRRIQVNCWPRRTKK